MCRSKEEAIKYTDDLMEVLGAKTVADLRKLDGAEIARAAAEVLFVRFAPERDGKYLPQVTWAAYTDGAVSDIDFLQGFDKYEFDFFAELLGEGFVPWASGLMEKKLEKMTGEERKSVESFLRDAKGDGSERWSRLYDQA